MLYWLYYVYIFHYIVLVSAVEQHKSVIITNNYTYTGSLLSLPPLRTHPTPLGHLRAPAWAPVLHSSFPEASVFTHGSAHTVSTDPAFPRTRAFWYKE